MKLTLEEIAEHTGGQCGGAPNGEVRGYSIDSRSIKRGELFIAIKGPRFDGHRFIAEAVQKGAAGALVSTEVAGAGNLPIVRVESTIEALQDLARAVRRRWGRPIIGITGSVGKTTTKEMVAAVLGKRHRVLRTTGNLNNQYGLPLSLLRAEPYHDIAVLEMVCGRLRSVAGFGAPAVS